MADYAEIICQAVDEIVTKKIEGISYDTTLNCTITDAENAELGKYTVTNGSATFTAYSVVTNYKVNDAVYVTVPNGDFNQQKIIIGKQVTDSSEPFVFTNPFKTILDMSNNLIIGDVGEKGLLANCPNNDDNLQEVLVWSRTFENQELKDYTRLGLSADFKTWLTNTVSGEYGLRLVVTTKQELTTSLLAACNGIQDILNDSSINIEDEYDKMEKFYDIGWGTNDIITFDEFKEKTLDEKKLYITNLMNSGISKYVMYLTQEDMYGNPYNFETYFSQEKVFDITSFARITAMELYFYQTPGTFTDINGDQIEYQDFLGNNLLPNLFVKEPYVCIGYDLSSFSDEQAILYTLDSSTYISSTSVSDEDNAKNIQLRWLHRFSDGTIAQVNTDSELDYDIRWYRYNLGAPSADEYSGVYWEKTNLEKTETRKEELETLEAIKNYQLLFHYENNTIGNANTNEYTYYKNFKPGYDDGSGGEVIPSSALGSSYSYLKDWSQKCLDYYNFSSEFAEHALVGMSTNSIQVTEDQGWKDLYEKGFVYHNNLHSNIYDYYTGDKITNSGCLHRVGFWELFTLAYKFYWLYPEKFDKLGAPNVWKTGGTANPAVWADYAGKNLYTELSYKGNSLLSDASGTLFTLNSSNTPLKNLFTYFTQSFGEWEYVEDDYGLRDYRPADTILYKELYNSVLTLYSKIDDPTYTVVVKPDLFSYQLQPDLTLNEEQIKVIILYENSPIRSNVLTFTNEREVVNQVTVDVTSAVQVVCNDGTFGNYRIYNEGNELLDSSQSKYCRELLCRFDSLNYPDEASALTEATSITWAFPTTNTMLRASYDDGTVLDYTDLAKKAAAAGGTYETINNKATIIYDSNLEQIFITRQADEDDGVSINPYQYYYIYSYYSTAYSNNTIQCTVVKDSVTYYGVKEFTFGVAGTTGTDCTLVIDFDNNETAVTVGGQYCGIYGEDVTEVASYKTPTLTARLYDSENNPIDFNDVTSGKNCTFTWSWFYARQNLEGLTDAPTVTEYKVVSITQKSFDAKNNKEIDVSQYYVYSDGKYIKATGSYDSSTTYYINNNGTYTKVEEDCYYTKDNDGTYIKANSYNTSDVYYVKQNVVKYEATDSSDKDKYYIEIVNDENNPSQVELRLKDEAERITYTYVDEDGKTQLDEKNNEALQTRMNSLWILQVTLEGWGDYKLVAYKPIPLRRYYPNQHYLCITGPTSVIYGSSGEPNYYRDPYRIWLAPRENNVEVSGKWSIFVPQYVVNGESSYDKDKYFVGSLSSKNILQPLNCYVDDAPQYGVQFKNISDNIIGWTQPVITIQNNYPSAMLNQWNGTDITLDTNNGTILSSAIAAGRKESEDNSFSGVILGDWSRSSTDTDISSQTGLYGFYHGSMSYAFKDDGTGFIGAADRGRIYFDGDGSQIYSQEWLNSSGTSGMLIDLDDGYINMNRVGGYNSVKPTEKEFGTNANKTYYEYLTYQRVTSTVKDDSKIYYLPSEFLSISLSENTYAKNKYFIYETTGPEVTTTEGETTGSLKEGEVVGVNTSEEKTTERTNSDNVYRITTIITYSSVQETPGADAGSSYTRNKTVTKEVETYTLATGDYNSEKKYYKINQYSKASPTELTYFSKTNYFYIYVNDYVLATDYDTGVQYYIKSSNTDSHYITLSSQETENYPLAIGTSSSTGSRSFRVAWDGSTYINNGYFEGNGVFKGTIHADDGYLKNLDLTGNLTATNGTITGGTITGSTIICESGKIGGWTIGSQNLYGGKVYLDSSEGILLNDTYLRIGTYSEDNKSWEYKGRVGYLSSAIGGGSSSSTGTEEEDSGDDLDGIGCYYTSGSASSQMKTTGSNAGLSYYYTGGGGGYISIQKSTGDWNNVISMGTTGKIYMSADTLTVKVDAEKQHGIYARFA